MSRKHLVVSAAAIGLVTLSACGNANQAGEDYIEPANAAQSEQVSLAVTQFDALGKVLTDQDGMTLYRFDGDSAQPPASNCDAECAAQWPPLSADGDVRVSGVADKAIGSVTRPDGTEQVTVNGWPVYRYAMDLDPGTFNGQGTDGKWFVVSPQGTKAGQPAERPAEQPTVAAADIPGFGAALTDENGMTLYLSTMDSKDPSAAGRSTGTPGTPPRRTRTATAWVTCGTRSSRPAASRPRRPTRRPRRPKKPPSPTLEPATDSPAVKNEPGARKPAGTRFVVSGQYGRYGQCRYRRAPLSRLPSVDR